MIRDKQYYLDLFSVTGRTLEKLCEEALSDGGGYADLFFENTFCSNLVLRDGEVSSGGMHIDYGVGIRTLSGDKTGYAYSESTDYPSMLAAARAASKIASGSGNAGAVNAGLWEDPVSGRPYPNMFRGRPNPAADRYPMADDWRNCDTAACAKYLEALREEISGRDTRIIKIISAINSQVSDILMFNSLGELKYETRPMGSLSVSVIFQSGDRIENKSVSRSFRIGAEMLSGELLKEIADEAVRNIDERFDARRPKGGRMSVVMGAGASGILLHEAMGHAFEADFNRKGQSIFSDKMGRKICSEKIDIVDDGTIRANRGAVNFDDEGVPGQRTYMVREGVLSSYLHDRISARHFGVTPTGNGRRESFRYNPIPRMRATYMESGDCDPGDLIAGVKKGIYVDEFSNGQVKIGEGDFTFYVKSGWLIENGRLTAPIKDINIIGNGPEALADIVGVGNDLKIDDGTWTCGKEQNCPVSCGIPTVLVRELTVGGE